MSTLRDEVLNDPLGRGYDAMTSEEVVASLKTVNREVNVASVTGQDLVEATAPADYAALDAAQLQQYWGICGMGDILVNGTNTKAILLAMFGVGTDTRTALAALQKTTVSRITELGLGRVQVGDVDRIRGV